MNYVSSGKTCADIGQNTPGIPNGFRNLTEYFLCHIVVRTDVEHINGTVLVEEEVQACGDQAAGQIADGGAQVAAGVVVFLPDISGGETNPDQAEMPGKRMDGQRCVPIVHSAGVEEGEDPAQQTEIHKEREKRPVDPQGSDPGEDKADIHGYAAQLEGEVPPVVDAVIQYKSNTPLFPNLACQQDQATVQEKIVLLSHHILPQYQCGLERIYYTPGRRNML